MTSGLDPIGHIPAQFFFLFRMLEIILVAITLIIVVHSNLVFTSKSALYFAVLRLSAFLFKLSRSSLTSVPNLASNSFILNWNSCSCILASCRADCLADSMAALVSFI